jgi:WD40-like Beta Propeller Repeat/Lon protease (S16) C-terminal proteolytic domain
MPRWSPDGKRLAFASGGWGGHSPDLSGIHTVIMPKANQKDLRDLPEEVRKEMSSSYAPEWVGTAHGTDQIPDFLRDGGPSGSSVPDLPSPKQPEAFPVPGDDRLGLDDHQRGFPTGPGSGQPCPEDTVRHSQRRPFLCGASQYTDLVPQGQILYLESSARTEDREHC